MSTFRTLIILTLAFALQNTSAVETCSRVAIINYQEVLVDTNSTEKGEGLRFHLEKDRTAKNYLESYQEGTKIRWQNAVLGTVGTSMLLGGILTNNDAGRKQPLLIGGATLMMINFLVAKTLQSSNEQNLIKAIEEYNKRNLPKIYFNPEQKADGTPGPGLSFSVSKIWSF